MPFIRSFLSWYSLRLKTIAIKLNSSLIQVGRLDDDAKGIGCYNNRFNNIRGKSFGTDDSGSV